MNIQCNVQIWYRHRACNRYSNSLILYISSTVTIELETLNSYLRLYYYIPRPWHCIYYTLMYRGNRADDLSCIIYILRA